MARQLPSLSAVRVFEAAARLGNFTAAAVELGMTQAAVSYQVKALEGRLGAPLFTRVSGRVRLTPAGARLLPPLTQALDGIAAAFDAIRVEDDALLTITTTPTFASTWLAWQLGAFQVAHPDLAVRLTTGNVLTDLHAGEADIAIRAGNGDWPGLAAHHLRSVDFTPMASPAFVAAQERRLERPLAPADLPGLPMLSHDDEWWCVWLDEAAVPDDAQPPRGGLRLDSQANEGHAAMAGQGFALLTPFLWASDVAEGRLVAPFAQVSKGSYGYWLVYPTERRTVPKIRRFRDWIINTFSEL
jgi:LysR family transcriptional regulator, glycine cleavage system transcriptional activator